LIFPKHVVMLYGLELPLRELPVQRLAYRHKTYQERFQNVLTFIVQPSDVKTFQVALWQYDPQASGPDNAGAGSMCG